jgi:hypothetical protein
MFRSTALRFAAAVLAFSLPLLTAAPAGAQTAPVTLEASYAAVLQKINPTLPLQKARAYVRSVLKDAWKTHLDPRFIMSIVTVESGWHASAVSRVGARGLGQLMPGTAARLGVNAWSPSENLRGTATYLASLVHHFGKKPDAVKLAIAGYNAGPRAVERYHGVPPYAETQHYVVKVLHVWKQLDARVGRAFTPKARVQTVEVAAAKAPDLRQWVTNVDQILPATESAVESAEAAPAPAAAATAGDDANLPVLGDKTK